MTTFTRIAAATALSLVSAGAAMAADLPARVAPAPYVAPLPVFTWTGAYFGINAGAAFDNRERLVIRGSGVRNGGNHDIDNTGFSGGGQVGYNYQIGGFGFGGGGLVVGVEADAMYMDTDKSLNFRTGAGNQRFQSGLDFLGTARGRVGLAFNQFMVYGTGGFAYGDVDSRLSRGGNNGRMIASQSGFTGGYTYGGGIEYALPVGSFLNFFKSSAVTVKAEYLRYELDSQDLDSGVRSRGTINGGRRFSVENDGNLARVGLNYKF